MSILFLYPILALVAVLVLIPALHKTALKIRLVDQPGGRKQHKGAVPLMGGLVIFPVFIVLSVIAGVGSWYLFAAILLLLVTGALDDYKGIGARIKFFMQFLAAFLIVVPGDIQIHHLGDLLGMGDIELGMHAIPLSLFCVVLLINSINLMDGLDGLAGGKSFFILFWFLLACVMAGQWASALPIAILMAALAGFLFYNMRSPVRKKARVFLGDAGSMCLGLVLGWYAIRLAQGPDSVMLPITVAWIIALPVMDACGQFIRRTREGKHPFTPDRGHFHHHFIEAGFPAGRATFIIILLGFILGGIGYGGIALGVSQPILFAGWVCLLVFQVMLSLKPQKFISCLERLNK